MSQFSMVNIPPKNISVSVVDGSVIDEQRWDNPNPLGELWWSGGQTPRYYTWQATVRLESPTQHGSISTQTPRTYNCLDIDVDDWIASQTGDVWLIRSIKRKTANEAVIIVEDWNRFNTFRSFQGMGAISSGQHVIFQANEVGESLFSDLVENFASTRFYAKVNSYFKYLNPTRNITVEQQNHGFVVGDKLSIESDGKYYKASNNNISTYVGIVTQILSTKHFMIDPITRIIQLKDAYGYEVGTKLYYGDDGLTDEAGSKLMYLVTSKEIPSSISGTNTNPTLINGNKFRINDYEVTTGTTISSIVDFINNDPTQDIYVANEVGSPTSVSGNLSTTYGLVGGFVPFSATINGVLVTFTSSTSGSSRYGMPVADEYDMVEAINNANIPNISANVSVAFVQLTNSTGGSINIVNSQNDTNGAPFAGIGSVSGLPLNTSASVDTSLSITRLDGGELKFRNVEGTPITTLGLSDSRSGRYPSVLVVEQGIRKGETHVVEDIPQRDILSVLVGDSAFVIDSGNGEWSTWFYTTTGWVLTATEDSARTDANVLSLIINHDVDSGELLIGTVSNNSRVIDISVNVIEEFDGDVTLNIGDIGDNSRLISDEFIDLQTTGVYSSTPSYIYKDGSDTDLVAYFNNNGSTKGQLKIIISYS